MIRGIHISIAVAALTCFPEFAETAASRGSVEDL
jgi:hypothetical protein